MYYPSSENKGADQLRGYREADLRLCFRLGKNPVFSRCGSFQVFPRMKKSRTNFSVTDAAALMFRLKAEGQLFVR